MKQYIPPRYNCTGLNFGKVDVGRYTDVSTRYVRAWAGGPLGRYTQMHLQRTFWILQVQGEHVTPHQAAAYPDPVPRWEGGYAAAADRQEGPGCLLDVLGGT